MIERSFLRALGEVLTCHFIKLTMRAGEKKIIYKRRFLKNVLHNNNETKGHIIDSLIFSKILDAVFETGAKCKIDEIQVGEEQTETSSATLTIEADNEDTLSKAVTIAEKHGAVKC